MKGATLRRVVVGGALVLLAGCRSEAGSGLPPAGDPAAGRLGEMGREMTPHIPIVPHAATGGRAESPACPGRKAR